MKKLLLILICLFVSFEVKSKTIVLKCIMTHQRYKTDDYSQKINPPETEILYLNKKKQILSPFREGHSSSSLWSDADSTISSVDVESYKPSIGLNKYDGSVWISKHDWYYYGKCEAIKDKPKF